VLKLASLEIFDRGMYINISLNMTQFPKILLVSKKIPDGVQRLIKGIWLDCTKNQKLLGLPTFQGLWNAGDQHRFKLAELKLQFPLQVQPVFLALFLYFLAERKAKVHTTLNKGSRTIRLCVYASISYHMGCEFAEQQHWTINRSSALIISATFKLTTSL